MAQTEEKRRELLEKANTLPTCPGVYIMRDKGGKVIYVGKSRKLKSRVSQYFQNNDKNVKTARMVSMVEDFDYYLCDSEMEALSLENTLIKQYTPKYNIRLKDAKSYPYIKITDEEYPRLVFTRRREGDRGRYYGPFSGSEKAYALIELLRRTLRLPSCSRRFPRDIGRERPCIYYQMNRCSGICTGQVTPEAHQKTMQMAGEILGGKTAQVKRELEEQMLRHAEEEQFEAAARCRDTIIALTSIGERQKVVASPEAEQDVVALYSDDLCSCVSVFYVRAGVLQDKADYTYGADSILEAEDMTTFLCEHYRTREYIPSQILLAFEMSGEDITVLSDYLTRLAGRRIVVRVPQRGTLHSLCEMVRKNAVDQAKLYKINTEKNEKTLVRLAELLCLESYPSRIEAYDISNFGAEHLTAGMIVCADGKFKKSDYRTFRIRTVSDTTDDYASMREAIGRRLEHLGDAEGSFAELPDLILLDGGRGHVSVVRELLAEREIDLPVFGMVKDEHHKTRALCTEHEEISIARENEVFTLIYRIQEEVHRYTVGRMHEAKRKTLTRSTLTEIRGIGEVKAKRLLAAFGGIRALRTASEAEIAAVQGITAENAAEVYRALHSDEKTNKREEDNAP